MELRQLEYLVAVAEEANFTRAAERVHISQSGVSAQIRQLERELGQALLDRSGRPVRLTEVGAAVLPYARAALDAVASARLAVDQLAGLVRGQVTFGMVSGCAVPAVPELLAGFHDLYPGVGITLTEDGSDRLVQALREGRLDLALIGSAGGPLPGLEATVVTDEAVVAAVAAGSDGPLPALQTVAVDALRDQPLISLPRGTGVRAALDAACASAGFTPRIVFEAGALQMVAQLADMGLGAAILPASVGQAHRATLHVVQIDRPQLRSRLELAWNPAAAANPAARALIDHARSFVRRLTAGPGPAT
jgi:DNA-binding transcriptional LysR family regulator